jgi:hypothetical protein
MNSKIYYLAFCRKSNNCFFTFSDEGSSFFVAIQLMLFKKMRLLPQATWGPETDTTA